MNNRIIKIMLLSVALTGTIVSCQKDSEMVPSQELSQKSLAQERSILFYKIDGEEYYQKFLSREERNEFIRYLTRLTIRGHIIVIEGNEKPSYAPSERDRLNIQTFDTEEIVNWSEEMIDKGYDVEYYFDEKRGIYVGCVVPKDGVTTTTAISTERDSDSM